MSVESDPKFKF